MNRRETAFQRAQKLGLDARGMSAKAMGVQFAEVPGELGGAR